MGAFETANERQFEELLRDGVTAVKCGQIRLAESLLNRASMLNPMEARPYVWLSATTEEPEQQRAYLEQAVACEPSNAAARRGLALLSGKIDRQCLMPETGESFIGNFPVEVETRSRAVKCPQCGGQAASQVASGLFTCAYCGYSADLRTDCENPYPVSDRLEQTLDFVLPTERGHSWAAARQHLSCESCGASCLLPAGQKAVQCAYCGSNQLVLSPELCELIGPQVIALMQLDEHQALKLARQWLRMGMFAPDDLVAAGGRLQLRQAYYSCWTFDGTIEAKWTCEVKVGSGNQEHWEAESGAHTAFFNDVLVSGVKAVKESELASIEPFNLVELREFKEDYLAGWPAMIYDRSLADASLVAREKVIKKLRPELYTLAAMGREKRNLSLNGSSWSGMTYKHILLPLWIGTYRYRGKDYRLLVNGQTGKVGGYKPQDKVKVLFSSLSMVALIVLGLIGLWIYLRVHGGIF